MTPAEQRIEAMVREGVVSPAEGEAMREALQRRGRWGTLLDPLAWSFATLPAAIVVALAGVAVGTLGVRFDGALDLHLAGSRVPLPVAVRDTVVSTMSLAVALWGASWIVARRGRLRDFVVAASLARLPYVLTAPLLLAVSPSPDELVRRAVENPTDPVLLLVALVGLPGLVLFVAMLHQGYRSGSGLLGARRVVSFVAALVVAEILSKLLVA